MIPVIEVVPGVFERAAGNPVLTSLDGEVRAPLQTILADSWTGEERAQFGVYMAEPFVEPAGKIVVGQPRYEMQGDNVVEVRDVQDAPKPEPRRDVFAELDAMRARLDKLEGR